MKRILIVAISALITVNAIGQKQNSKVSDVTEPQFTGINNLFAFQNESANLLISKYLMNEIIYPEQAINCHYEGTEVVQFVISAAGNVSDIKIINSVCPAIDKEIILVLNNTNGMWIPGYSEGKPVEMTKEISLVFNVANNSKESAKEVFMAKAMHYFNCGNKELYVNNNAKKALKYYSKGINYLPNDQGLLLLRGLCRYELGDKEGARNDWNRLVSLGNPRINEISTQMEKMQGYAEMLAILEK